MDPISLVCDIVKLANMVWQKVQQHSWNHQAVLTLAAHLDSVCVSLKRLAAILSKVNGDQLQTVLDAVKEIKTVLQEANVYVDEFIRRRCFVNWMLADDNMNKIKDLNVRLQNAISRLQVSQLAEIQAELAVVEADVRKAQKACSRVEEGQADVISLLHTQIQQGQSTTQLVNELRGLLHKLLPAQGMDSAVHAQMIAEELEAAKAELDDIKARKDAQQEEYMAAIIAALTLESGALSSSSLSKPPSSSSIGNASSRPADSLLCPITRVVMVDPVVLCETGHTYERRALEEWLARKRTCPKTNTVLQQAPQLVTNWTVKQMIADYLGETPASGGSALVTVPCSNQAPPAASATLGNTSSGAAISALEAPPAALATIGGTSSGASSSASTPSASSHSPSPAQGGGIADTAMMSSLSGPLQDKLRALQDLALLDAAKKGDDALVARLLAAGANVATRDVHWLTPLHFAAAQGHEAVVKLLLAAGAKHTDPLDIPEEVPHIQPSEEVGDWGQSAIPYSVPQLKSGLTPLYLAAKQGHEAVVQLLLAAGADTEHAKPGMMPLHAAVVGAHAPVVQLLVVFDANLDAVDEHGQCALYLAAKEGLAEIVQLLLNGDADKDGPKRFSETPLYIAAKKGHTKVVELLLAAGASKGEANPYYGRSPLCKTPLYVAIMGGHAPVVELLLASGASTDGANSEGQTPLYFAAEKGQAAIVKLLLAAGASKDAARWNGATSLYVAAQGGYAGVVELLLAAGASKDAAHQDGSTSLYVAAQNGHAPVVQLLLAAGADKDAAWKGDHSPLYTAAARGHEAVVQLLLAAGADKEAATKDGATPLYAAAEKGHSLVVQLLLEAGANKEAAKQDGWRPLHAAASCCSAEVVRLLLDAGADKRARTPPTWGFMFGKTALRLASEYNRLLKYAFEYPEVAQLLR